MFLEREITDNRFARNHNANSNTVRYTNPFDYLVGQTFFTFRLRQPASKLSRVTPLSLASSFECSLQVTFHDSPK